MAAPKMYSFCILPQLVSRSNSGLYGCVLRPRARGLDRARQFPKQDPLIERDANRAGSAYIAGVWRRRHLFNQTSAFSRQLVADLSPTIRLPKN